MACSLSHNDGRRKLLTGIYRLKTAMINFTQGIEFTYNLFYKLLCYKSFMFSLGGTDADWRGRVQRG
jgi:hypothetical protein